MLNYGSADVYAEIFADDKGQLRFAARHCQEQYGSCGEAMRRRRTTARYRRWMLPTRERLTRQHWRQHTRGGEDLHSLADAGTVTRTRWMVGGSPVSWADLQWVFTYLEKHGVEGGARGGGIVRFGEDETGRGALRRNREAVIPVPAKGAGREEILAALGQRSGEAGSAVCKSSKS